MSWLSIFRKHSHPIVALHRSFYSEGWQEPKATNHIDCCRAKKVSPGCFCWLMLVSYSSCLTLLRLSRNSCPFCQLLEGRFCLVFQHFENVSSSEMALRLQWVQMFKKNRKKTTQCAVIGYQMCRRYIFFVPGTHARIWVRTPHFLNVEMCVYFNLPLCHHCVFSVGG